MCSIHIYNYSHRKK
ncbi:hypothetical protein PFFCH_03836 [Plasmodium falciparum FCH/4]|uniref:Uncharacterized protein n=1 Tax=Plasmodium falciparum FCH/4 TaxID=1036724 RepID=A0A024VJK5_PLAFA|nr:hypothetical protein PFFCH_03836 [Plasmodium falciparum FCH/4]